MLWQSAKKYIIGALVSTLNDSHTSYFSCVEPHGNGEELSVNFATGISSKYLWLLQLWFLLIKLYVFYQIFYIDILNFLGIHFTIKLITVIL